MFSFSEDAETNPLTADQRGSIDAFLRSVMVLSYWLVWIEFTRNAIQSMDGVLVGRATNLVKWFLVPRRGGGFNWGLLDTGKGIDPHTMVNGIGQLRRSDPASKRTTGKVITGKRHGIGARMTALRSSPEGTIWTSLCDGVVSTARLWLDETSDDPVKITHERPMPLDEYQKVHPDWLRPEILQAGHGTQVTFNDLMVTKKQATTTESEKLQHLISRRWFKALPAPIKVEAIDKDGDHWSWSVIPIGVALDSAGERFESVEVAPGVTVYAWLLPENSSELEKKFAAADIFDGGRPRATFGIMQDGEIYKLLTGGAAYGKMRSWGLTHGAERVTILLDLGEDHFMPSDDRSRLLPVGGTDRQGDDDFEDKEWGIEYSEIMPQGLKDYIRSVMLGSDEERFDKLKEWQLARILPSTGVGIETRRTTCKRCGETYGKCECPCPGCNKRDCECPENKKRKKGKGSTDRGKPGADPNNGAFWPEKIDWKEMPEGPSLPCQFVRVRGGELYMNSGYKHYKKLVALLESPRYGFDHEVAERIAQQVYVSVAVDVVAGAMNNRKPDPEQKQFEDTLILPHLIACKIEDVVALYGFTSTLLEVEEEA